MVVLQVKKSLVFSAFPGHVFSLTKTAFRLHVCELFIALENKYLL